MQDAVIVSSVRTAVGKSGRGSLASARPDDLAATAIDGAFARVPQLNKGEVDDVVLGCAHPEAEQGMNVARIASLRAGLPVEVSAMTVNRFCASGLQAIAQAADRIRGGGASVVVAGGTESMSMIPMGGHKISANPWLVDHLPATYLSMGLTAERVGERYRVSREEADGFALASHKKALDAIAAGRFTEEIVPFEWTERTPNGSAKLTEQKRSFAVDEGPRADTSPEALAKLKPAFHAKGTVTAGNSSQTSDGAAASILMSGERAAALGLKPMARFLAYATAGCAPEVMGIGPVHAVPKALRLAGLKLEEIGLVELNEAFAAQSLAVIRQLGIDPEMVNVNGGAIALGHPLGCTGAKLTATLLHEMRRRKVRYGLVTMCVGGGMGAAGIFENLN
jgi:acetyl-CoA acyltransferase